MIVAIVEMAEGNSSVGTMWLETKVFSPETSVGVIMAWAHKKNHGRGKVIITFAEEELGNG